MEFSKKHFENLHNKSDEGWGFSFRNSQRYRFLKTFRLIKDMDSSVKVLEIGCSAGEFTYYLKKKFTNIFATDISEAAIIRAKEKLPDITFIVDSLPVLSIKESNFDLITVLEVLYYLDPRDQIKALNSIKNKLNGNGYLLLSTRLGPKPYYSVKEIEELVSQGFIIKTTDNLFIKQYYLAIEANLYKLYTLFDYHLPLKLKEIKGFRKVPALFIRVFINNIVVFYLYGWIFRLLIKGFLKFVPIRFFEKLLYWLFKEKSRHIHIILAQKR